MAYLTLRAQKDALYGFIVGRMSVSGIAASLDATSASVEDFLRGALRSSAMDRVEPEKPKQLTRLEAVTKVLRENQGKARKYLKTEIKKRLNLDVSIAKIAQIQKDEGFKLCVKKRKSDLDCGVNREIAENALRENFRLTQADYVRVINDAIGGGVSVSTAVRFASEVFGCPVAEAVALNRSAVLRYMRANPYCERHHVECEYDVTISRALWGQLRRQLDFGSV